MYSFYSDSCFGACYLMIWNVLAYYFKNSFCTVDCISVKLCFGVPQFQYEISVNVKTVTLLSC